MAEFVWEVMTRGVVTVRPDASLVEAAQLMRAQDIGDVLVTADGHMIGVLTDRDITLRAVAAGADPLTVSAQAVCTPNPVVVGVDEAVSAAVELMRDHAIRRLPVVQDGHPVGMVSLGDLAVSQSPTSALAHISRARPGPWPESETISGGHLGVDTISASGPGPGLTPWAAPGPTPAAGIGPGTAALPATGPRTAPTSRGDTGGTRPAGPARRGPRPRESASRRTRTPGAAGGLRCPGRGRTPTRPRGPARGRCRSDRAACRRAVAAGPGPRPTPPGRLAAARSPHPAPHHRTAATRTPSTTQPRTPTPGNHQAPDHPPLDPPNHPTPAPHHPSPTPPAPPPSDGNRRGDHGRREPAGPYPPGVPVICPGERIDRAVVEYLGSGVEHSMYVPDPSDPELRTLRVVAR